MSKRLITDEVVAGEFARGARSIAAPRGECVVTPGAWSKARELGVVIDDGTAKRSRAPASRVQPAAKAGAPPLPKPAEGSAERIVDKSGLVVVRGKSVKLGKFAGAGERDVGIVDVITAKDGSPMAAGVMSWTRENSFPWSLDYDEIDLVLEGVLHIQIDGRTVESRAGDICYIPKGSRIVFGTPSRVRVFYVTYPANWEAAAAITAARRS